MNNPKQYFVATACIFNKDNKILLTRRYDPEHLIVHDLWQFPGGGIEQAEDPRETAIREVREETGLTVKIMTEYPHVYSHVFKGNVHIVVLSYPAEYVSGSIDITQDKETSDAKWLTINEIMQLDCLPNIQKQAQEHYAKRLKGSELG